MKKKPTSRLENGQTTVEYLLIVAVMVMGITLLGKELREKVPLAIDQVFSAMPSMVAKLESDM